MCAYAHLEPVTLDNYLSRLGVLRMNNQYDFSGIGVIFPGRAVTH